MRGRVLVAIEEEERRNRIVATLAEGGEFEVAGAVEMRNDVAMAIDDAAQEIDFLLVTAELGGASALTLCREVTASRPDLGVVVMVDEPSAELAAAAVEAGARGFLPLQPSVEDVHDRLESIAEWQRRVRGLAYAQSGTETAGRVVVVNGAKGGVGTSTVALHLALLALTGTSDLRVCLVDLDLQQRGLRHLLDMNGRRTVLDLVPVAESLTARHVDEALFPHYSGLKVLLGPHEPERADEVTGDVARHVLGAIRGQFDLVIVDAGSVVTEANAVAMDLADDLLMVVTPDVPALRAARETIDLISRLEVAKAGDVRILFNRTSTKSEVQPDLGRRVTGAEACKVGLPSDWKHLEEIANGAAALDLGDSPFRRALTALGRELQLGRRLQPIGATAQRAHDDADRAIAEMKSRRRRGRRSREEAGQTTVELVFGIVVSAVLLLLLIQVGLYAMATVSSRRAADAAAITGNRAGVVDRQQRAEEAARSRVPGFMEVVDVTDEGGGTWSATVDVPDLIFPIGADAITQTGTYTD